MVHAVNEDYDEMAGDFIKLGFLEAGEPQGSVMRCEGKKHTRAAELGCKSG